MLGTLKLPLNSFQYFTVAGGPYKDCPETMSGVKMAAEIKQACAVDIPTRDFQVPDALRLSYGLERAVALMLQGEPLYVGCYGGKGRTGLFLAVLAKAMGIQNPVEYVREHYYRHAVETDEQYQFVTDFPITPEIQQQIRRVKRWSWLRFWQRNLTRMPRGVKQGETVVIKKQATGYFGG